MTLNDIKNEVASLCFLSQLPLDSAFVFALNRALWSIYTERGVMRLYTLYQSAKKRHTELENIRVSAGETSEHPLPRGTFSLYIGGKGMVTLTSDREIRQYPFSGECEHICGFFGGDFTLSISSEYPYTIHSLCHIEEELSASDMPTKEGAREYRLRELIPNLLSPHRTPTDRRGIAIDGSKIIADTLYIPYDYEGIISIEYRAAPPRADIDFPDEELDISEELTHLVPLLSAAYLSLEDEPERSAYYLSLYKNGLAALIAYDTESLDTRYNDRLGWC